MLSDRIEQQSFALKVLRTHIKKKRIAHTYLISGRAGSGHEDIAKAFAVALNDEDHSPLTGMTSDLEQRIDRGAYPDVRWLGEDAEASSIKIQDVRAVIEWSFLRPYEGIWKVLIVKAAERLTVEAQNALLKTLEEPPASTVFLLLVENKKKLLETIDSRAFEIRLMPVGIEMQSPFSALTFQGVVWEDFFEGFQGKGRYELKASLDGLFTYLRGRLETLAERDDALWPAYLDLIEAVYEAKDAIESNVNSKLVLTNLTVKFKRLLPDPEKVTP